jgi:hypothetical protein
MICWSVIYLGKWLHVIEFQKRGLPHAHILLILKWERSPKVEDRPKLKGSWESIVFCGTSRGCACAHLRAGGSSGTRFRVLVRGQLRYTLHVVKPPLRLFTCTFEEAKGKAGDCRTRGICSISWTVVNYKRRRSHASCS